MMPGEPNLIYKRQEGIRLRLQVVSIIIIAALSNHTHHKFNLVPLFLFAHNFPHWILAMRFFTPNVMIVVVTSKTWQRGRKHIKIISLLCALNLYWYLFLAHTRRQSGKRVELSVYCGKFVIRPLAKSMCSFHTRSLKLIIIGDSVQRIHTNDSEHGQMVLYSYKSGTHETDNTPNRWRKTVCSLVDESNKKMNTVEKTLTQKCLAMRFGYDSSVPTVSTSLYRNFLHDFLFVFWKGN